MKITDKKKPIKTIPKGIWEGSRPTQKENENKNKKTSSTDSTDLQGNGYPSNRQSQ